MALSNASFLPDEKDCAESWRAQRRSNGVHCVACGSTKVESRAEQYRGHLCRYHCQDCDRWSNDLSGTALEYSKVSLNRWIYMMRELDKGRPVNQIGTEIEVSYKTALRMAHLIRQGLYRHRSDDHP